MTKETGAAFLLTIVAGGLMWYHSRQTGTGVKTNAVTTRAGEITPTMSTSNDPNETRGGWSTPFYLKSNYPSMRNLGSAVMPSVVNKGLMRNIAPQEIPPQW